MNVFSFLKSVAEMPGATHMLVIGALGVLSVILQYHLEKRGHSGLYSIIKNVLYCIGGLVVLDLIFMFARYALATFGIT